MKECPECGENLADDAVHCGHCGAQVEEGEEDNKQTMFGVGALSDEDLENLDDGGDSESDEDDGFRLPSPGEMEGGDESEKASREAQKSGDEGGRPGLKGPSDDDDAAALAETEALPQLDEGEDAGRQQDGSDLQKGRLSSPGAEEGAQQLDAPPDLGDQSSPDDSGGSPFAGDDQQAQSVGGQQGSTQAKTGESKTDTIPPEDQGAGAGTSGRGGGDQMADTADIVSEPGDEPEPAPQSGTSATGGGDSPQQAAGTPSGGGSGAGGRQQGGRGQDQKPAQPASPGSDRGAEEQAASRDPRTEDSRFGGGGAHAEQQQDQPPAGGVQGQGLAQEQQPQSSADSSSDNKTLLIIVGILAAMFLVCGIVGLAAFWMGFP